MNRCISLCLSLFGITRVFCQVTFWVNEIPEVTPHDAEMYISGDFEGWTGGQENFKLAKTESGIYHITLPQSGGTIQYKFTLGDWGMVEKGASGEEISNRTYTFGGNVDTVKISVLNWAHLSTAPSTMQPNVSILSESFEMPQLNKERKIWIYLPPDYNSREDSYPVLYMHDGQNVFDDKTSFVGEWHVDETLNELYDQYKFGLIVVAIDHGNGDRFDEYNPWSSGQGSAYVSFIVETLKPFIDKNFKTLSEPENTGIMGSSMGGLISYFALLQYPEVFGKGGIFSPSFWVSDEVVSFTQTNGDLQNNRMYLLAGGNEGSLVDEMTFIGDLLLETGFSANNIYTKVDPDGNHNEAFWSEYFKNAISWLWERNDILGTNVLKENAINIYPNPATETININHYLNSIGLVKIYGLDGKIVYNSFLTPSIDIRFLEKGIYIMTLYQNNQLMMCEKFIKD